MGLNKEQKVDLNKASSPYTFREKVLRCLWHFVYLFLFRLSPRLLYGWRRFLLRQFGAKIGQNVCIYPTASIVMPWKLSVGDNSTIGPDVKCYNVGGISIGRHVVVSQYAYLCSSSHDYTSSTFAQTFSPISIKDYSWICADAFVGPGVTVGEGAVVGARAVVVKDVDAWMIVAGNPAKYIKKREIIS